MVFQTVCRINPRLQPSESITSGPTLLHVSGNHSIGHCHTAGCLFPLDTPVSTDNTLHQDSSIYLVSRPGSAPTETPRYV